MCNETVNLLKARWQGGDVYLNFSHIVSIIHDDDQIIIKMSDGLTYIFDDEYEHIISEVQSHRNIEIIDPNDFED